MPLLCSSPILEKHSFKPFQKKLHLQYFLTDLHLSGLKVSSWNLPALHDSTTCRVLAQQTKMWFYFIGIFVLHLFLYYNPSCLWRFLSLQVISRINNHESNPLIGPMADATSAFHLPLQHSACHVRCKPMPTRKRILGLVSILVVPSLRDPIAASVAAEPPSPPPLVQLPWPTQI